MGGRPAEARAASSLSLPSLQPTDAAEAVEAFYVMLLGVAAAAEAPWALLNALLPVASAPHAASSAAAASAPSAPALSFSALSFSAPSAFSGDVGGDVGDELSQP